MDLYIENELIKLYQLGKSCVQIGEKLNISHGNVWNILKKRNIETRKDGEHKRKDFFNQNFFEIIDSERKAYWLGFMYADGSISRFSCALSLSSLDKRHLEKFKQDIDSSAKIRDSMVNDGLGKFHPTSHLSFCSLNFYKSLIKQGCTSRKSLNLVFPNSDIVPPVFLNHFIRGYFDGDGSIGKYTYKNQTSYRFSVVSSKAFIEEFERIICDKCNLKTTKIQKNSKSNVYYSTHSGIENTKKIYDFLYSGATVFLDRKKETFESILNK